MKFHKDILLIDLETTGGDWKKSLAIQFAAILLDKETLEEKATFASYIKQDLSEADPVAMRINGITAEQLKDAPDQDAVTKQFFKKFGTDVFLASWVEYLDRRVLMRMLEQAGITERYDYHYIDLWPIAYIYMIKRGYDKDFKSTPMFEFMGIKDRASHDALEDCRMEAEVFRKIVFDK